MADKKISVKIGADNSQLKAKTKESTRSMQSFGSAVSKIGGLMAGAFSISKIAAFGKEAMVLANQLEGVKVAFENVGSAALLDELREATKGTVTELELMRRSVQASNFKIPMDSLASLFEFATKRAQDTGESVDYLVNSIVLGIGRKSPLILDNLGISAVSLRKELKGAGVEMNTVADIAAAVGRIANEEMKDAGDIIETNAVQLERLTAQWKNLQAEIGKGISTAWVQAVDVGLSYADIWSEKNLTFWEKISSIGNPAMFAYADAMAEVYEEMEGLGEMEQRILLIEKQKQEKKNEAERIRQEKEAEADLLREKEKIIAAENAEYEALKKSNHERYLRRQAIKSEQSEGDKKQDASVSADITEIEAGIDAMVALDDTTFDTVDSVNKLEYAFRDLGSEISSVGLAIASDFAQNLGYAMAQGEGFEEVLSDLGAMVANALGDILIMTGTAMGPSGIPLVLSGLVMKGISGFASAGGFESADVTSGASYQQIYTSESTLRGNDIYTSNNYSTDLYNRVG